MTDQPRASIDEPQPSSGEDGAAYWKTEWQRVRKSEASLRSKLTAAEQRVGVLEASEAEYMQVAALVCADLDLLNSMADDEQSLEGLCGLIHEFHRMKDEAVADPVARQRRYSACGALFNAIALAQPQQEQA